MASRCLAMYSQLLTSDVMEQVISHVVPLLGSSDNVIHRQGAIEAIACILNQYTELRSCGVIYFNVLFGQ